ncbi:unnamed protein product [Didymodactylos carnosus]|uniref:Uncharacterized protein n=1 Tax=Didymodactylos carnosus TaxID=1234261 RepID=A0A815YJ45_9BILA|nr:unnamed protein product [Didymodactylos carnosus]CAF1571196.1 unnamed protein product [Didymodactylos carnosus]CAF3583698.1 unnamed protein product [Didymodactylos carnosus]CAF4434614.1 unnamed protein product [Didymodactylos carnosus]
MTTGEIHSLHKLWTHLCQMAEALNDRSKIIAEYNDKMPADDHFLCSYRQRYVSDPSQQIKNIYISTNSTKFDRFNDFVGFLIYSYDDKTDFYLSNRHCKTGCLLIKEISTVNHIVHNGMPEKLFEWFFNGTEVDQKFKGIGFRFRAHKREWRFHRFNDEEVHPNEKKLVEMALLCMYENGSWITNQSMNVDQLKKMARDMFYMKLHEIKTVFDSRKNELEHNDQSSQMSSNHNPHEASSSLQLNSFEGSPVHNPAILNKDDGWNYVQALRIIEERINNYQKRMDQLLDDV